MTENFTALQIMVRVFSIMAALFTSECQRLRAQYVLNCVQIFS